MMKLAAKLFRWGSILWSVLFVAPSSYATEETVDFPSIDQRTIRGAEYRCGVVALGSWLIYLDGKVGFEAIAGSDFESSPFVNDQLSERERTILSQVDQIAGGDGAVQMLRIVETLIAFVHKLPDASFELRIHYYNLPEPSFLQQIAKQGRPTILLHGIYDKDLSTGRLRRTLGHFTCLLDTQPPAFTASTYGADYRFELSDLPMDRLVESDQYRSAGAESWIYLHCPPDQFPHYTFKSFAPVDRTKAKLQSHLDGPVFAKKEQTVLLEGALVFELVRQAP